MSDHSRTTALHSGGDVEPDAAAATRRARALDGAHASLMLSLQPGIADDPSTLIAPSSFLPGMLPTDSFTLNTTRRASVSSSRSTRGARIACMVWAASGTPAPAIDRGVVPSIDLEPAAALYFGLQAYAPAGKKATRTQEGGHVKGLLEKNPRSFPSAQTRARPA